MLSLNVQIPFAPHHAGLEEYASYLQTFSTTRSRYPDELQRAKRFIRRYPDLKTWFAAPLVERVGRAYGEAENQVSDRINYDARRYVLFLAASGRMTLDWDWLLAVEMLHPGRVYERLGTPLGDSDLIKQAQALGYRTPEAALMWSVGRLCLHTGVNHYSALKEEQILATRDVIRAFGLHPDIGLFYGSVERYQECAYRYLSYIYTLQVVLYHLGQIKMEPCRSSPRAAPVRLPIPPRMQTVITRFLAQRRQGEEASSVAKEALALRLLTEWLTTTYPHIVSFAELTHDHLLAFSEALHEFVSERTKRPYSAAHKRGIMSCLNIFFRLVIEWEWEDVPDRPLLLQGDIPKRPHRIPRYIPEDELERLMTAIRALDDKFQRTALLIARWSGARRGEIARLSFDCLDTYPDGTPRLHIPIGKTKRERVVPLHEEAADAIRLLQAEQQQGRSFPDQHTGLLRRYLFVHRGQRLKTEALFENPLEKACRQAGLVDDTGKPLITAHRFRHTVGTQLAERGARLHTIMRVLGHESPNMSMVYATISDKEVLKDYQMVLAPGAVLAGPSTHAVRNGILSQDAVEWLKTNFFKTELELGRCLRLPEEGPCECDLYLTCSKFVTTPAYAPRLRRRRRIEYELIEDAQRKGWMREVERHRCTVQRLERLLTDLGEPIEGLEAAEE
jgi:integrase